jgi:hypothetical protein
MANTKQVSENEQQEGSNQHMEMLNIAINKALASLMQCEIGGSPDIYGREDYKNVLEWIECNYKSISSQFLIIF